MAMVRARGPDAGLGGRPPPATPRLGARRPRPPQRTCVASCASVDRFFRPMYHQPSAYPAGVLLKGRVYSNGGTAVCGMEKGRSPGGASSPAGGCRAQAARQRVAGPKAPVSETIVTRDPGTSYTLWL